VRLVQHYLSGHSTTSPIGGVLVRVDRSGIPQIIPGSLRSLIRGRVPDVIRGVLTVLSLYRVMYVVPKIQMGSIVDPFKGLDPLVPLSELRYIWGRYFSK